MSVIILSLLSLTLVRSFEITPEVTKLIANTVKEDANGDPFYVISLDSVYKQYERWHALLPNIRPHYAIKANPNPAIIELLHGLGAGFDCASKVSVMYRGQRSVVTKKLPSFQNEIKQVMKVTANAQDIIYAQVFKPPQHIAFARAAEVEHMTFDSVQELTKIAKIFPQAKLVLRLR